MNQSLKSTVGAFAILCAMGAYIVWFGPNIAATPAVWALRVVLPLACIGAGAVFVREMFRKDIEPDLIRLLFGKPFERDGVCFVLKPTAHNGVCYLNIIYQNQYERACTARVVVRPPAHAFAFGKRDFEGVAIDIQCEGGAFGIAHAPVAIPSIFQGRALLVDVRAATHYPDGGGQLLRFRNGVRVGRASKSGLGSAAAAVGAAGITVAMLATGVALHALRPIVTLSFPQGVAEAVPLDAQPLVETLWRPGDLVRPVAAKLAQAMIVGAAFGQDPSVAHS